MSCELTFTISIPLRSIACQMRKWLAPIVVIAVLTRLGVAVRQLGMRLVLNYACLGIMASVLPHGRTVDFAMPVTPRTAAHRTAKSIIIQSNGEKIARTRTIESASSQHRDQDNNNPVNRQSYSKSYQFFTLSPVESKFSNEGLANSCNQRGQFRNAVTWEPRQTKS